ncbi:MAG: VOC family protein [Bifidobacteriaceae bacterium]|jgi:catechol 2,3-dioxygenase-like lactoylglutathione lyase family enzyme|nr:VOC family protein [Bifidobacteriaceae bacterium]
MTEHKQVLGTGTITQVALVVRDVRATRAKWAAFLGVDEPPLVDAGDYEVTQTTVHGQPDPEASCTMAFFDIAPGMQLELIEPNGKPSAWQDFLDSHGEGVHHLAFGVKDTDAKLAAVTAEYGWPVLQRGRYGDGSGQYAYIGSSPDLKVDIETLESF